MFGRQTLTIEMDPSADTQRSKVTEFPRGFFFSDFAVGYFHAPPFFFKSIRWAFSMGVPTCVVGLELRAQPHEDRQAAERNGQHAITMLVVFGLGFFSPPP